MRQAVKAGKKEMGLLKAAKAFNVPRLALKDYVKTKDTDIEKRLHVPLGRKSVLSPETENHLVQCCSHMEKAFCGLTMKDFQRMAFQLAILNNLPHPFSTQKVAGRKWLHLFLRGILSCL
jgi:hypothetical protein